LACVFPAISQARYFDVNFSSQVCILHTRQLMHM
jgi:hypothetical protein